jgi:tetratricopeptide (TPR) repeat protein/DNA-binding CsgD family transcriptional regulator
MDYKKLYSQLMTIFRTTFSNPEKAVSLYQDITRQIQKSHSLLFNSDANYVLYRIYLRQGLYQQAKECIENNLASVFHLDDKRRLFYLLMGCSGVNLILGHVDIAYQFTLNAHDISRGLNDEIANTKVEFLFGRVLLARNQYAEARAHFSKALEYVSTYSDDKEKGDILLNMCGCYMHEGNWAEAILNGLKVIETKENYLHQIELPASEDKNGWVVFGCGEYTRIAVNDQAILADGYYNVGVCYESLGDAAQATEYLLKALSIKEKIGDLKGIANCVHALGMLYTTKKEYSKALAYLDQSRQYFSETQNISSLGFALLNIAELKAEELDNQACFDLIDEAERHFLSVNDNYGRVIAHLSRATALRRTGRFIDAIDKLNLTLVYASGINALAQQIRCLHERGLCYQELRNAKMARTSFLEALTLAKAQGNKKECIALHESLCTHYDSIHQYKDALEHHRLLVEIKEQLFNEESDRREKNLMILYEVEKYKRTSEESKQALLLSQAEVQAKTQELAEFALRIVEKQEFLDLIERDLDKALNADLEEKNQLILDLQHTVHRASTAKEEWQSFQTQFNGIQQDFVNAITRLYPTLSPTELKVCALLRMNLRTKEIADIMHISSKAVENHRLRLRKKMGLERDANLVKVLFEMGTTQ